MAITKTSFINYTRCPRFCALDNVKKLEDNISYEEYRNIEEKYLIQELLGEMFEDGVDLTNVTSEQLKVMLPYYNKVEQVAGKLASKYFKGNFKYAVDTKMQESFDTLINGIRYLCYVDIYNEDINNINIIEVKATTSKKYFELGPKINKELVPIIKRGDNGIYYFLEDIDNISNYMDEDKYYEKRSKLFDKYTSVGHYIYDVAVQRYIIEHDFLENNIKKNVKYYLAVLNHEYTFAGEYLGGEPLYRTDDAGNDIISFIDVSSITKDYQDIINNDLKKVERYVLANNPNPFPLGPYCEYKKSTKCKYKDICWKKIPEKNSVFNFLDNHHGFLENNETKHSVYDLVEMGYLSMGDVPNNFLQREKNIIQKEAYITNKPYLRMDRLESGINAITYPIYHLDFESFPCPLPRYKGEKCYSQSLFQFSLHIEKEPGVCDKEKDHYGYLAKDHLDHRLELVELMLSLIDVDKPGTVLVYNQSFEKTRIKELASFYPEYRLQLNKLNDMVFDLMYILKGNKKLYEELGYEDGDGFNFYDARMSGSFSIKKILPLFSSISYKDMEIGNGVQAYTAYIEFPKLTPKDFSHRYQKLIEYCQQDTWSMVDILKGLREYVKNSKHNV